MTTHGTLYLIPVTLGDEDIAKALPPASLKIAQALDTFIVENEKSARRFLGMIGTARPIREITLSTLNEHTKADELPALVAPLLEGKDIGLISEAGCPGVADPGAQAVALAHQHHIRVVPLVGPSSILLALMASGLNGQRFTFLGYLPSDKTARGQRLKEIEKVSQQHNETQVFIETPYRNQHLLKDILATCNPATRLCVACDLTLESESIHTQPIRQWKAGPLPDLHKRPAVFLLLAN